jgi:hypothetical protein
MYSLVAAMLIAAGPAPVCPKDEPVKVMVLVILATDKNDTVHERLQEIAAEVRKKAPQLTGFDLHKTYNKSLKLGESANLELIGAAKLQVSIDQQTDEEGRMTVRLKPPMLDEITYACTCGKFVPIITNHYTEEKQRLIIAVMAKPCKKK